MVLFIPRTTVRMSGCTLATAVAVDAGDHFLRKGGSFLARLCDEMWNKSHERISQLAVVLDCVESRWRTLCEANLALT